MGKESDKRSAEGRKMVGRSNSGFHEVDTSDESALANPGNQNSTDIEMGDPKEETVHQSTSEGRSSSFKYAQKIRRTVRTASRTLSRESRNFYRDCKNFVDYSPFHKFIVLLPIFSGIIPPLFICVSLAVASIHNNLFEDPENNLVPYISDIGNFKPQSSVFTFGLTISSMCILGTVFIRYQQGLLFFQDTTKRLNTVACVFGVILVVGKLMVSAFQLSSSKAVHYLAAVGYVIGSVCYCTCQTCITAKNRKYHSRTMLYSRICLVSGMIFGALLFVVFLIPPLTRFNRGSLSVAQGGEWLFAALKMAFFITFYTDFTLVQPVFELRPMVVENQEQ